MMFLKSKMERTKSWWKILRGYIPYTEVVELLDMLTSIYVRPIL